MPNLQSFPSEWRLPDRVPDDLKLLTRDEFEGWLRDGYVVVRNVVDPETIRAAVDDIHDFIDASPDDPATWLKPGHDKIGMIEMFARASLWKARTAPQVHAAFADLYGTERLCTSNNRANFNLPISKDFKRENMLHWDLDTSRKGHNPAIQCVLALSDAGKGAGTFMCVPGSHKPIAAWHAGGCKGTCPDMEACMEGREAIEIPLKAGDMVCWTMALIHGNGANTSDTPRKAAFVHVEPVGTVRGNTYGIEGEAYAHRVDVVESWREAGWQQGFARTVGCSERLIESWTRQCFKAGHMIPLPDADRPTELTGDLRQQVDDHLPRITIDEPIPYTDGGGRDAGKNVAQFRICKRAAIAVENLTGIKTEPDPPAELDQLGRRIVGLEPWPTS
jgi:hypothetical protein